MISGAGFYNNRLFFGWTVVLGCFVGMLGNTGQVIYASLGVMIKPLGLEFGWSRGEISLALSFLTVAIAVVIPISGMLIDKFGAKRIVIVSIVLSALAMITGPLYVSSLGLFYFMIVLISTVGAPTNSVAYVRVISNWFDRRRGLFIGINASGLGVGFAVMPLLANWAIQVGGWKAAYVCLGIFLTVIILPAVYLLVIDRPENIGLHADGLEDSKTPASTAVNEHGLSLRQASISRDFWLMLLIIPTVAFCLNGILTQIVPLLTDRGASSAVAATVASTMGMSMAFSRVVVGYLLDKYFAPYVAMIVFALVLLGIGLLTYGNNIILSYAAAILMGFGLGAESDLMAFLVSRYYGLRHFGVIFGCVFTSYMVGTGLGPYVLGNSFDITGSYDQILHVCMVLIAVVTALFAFFNPYKRITQ